MCSSDLSDPAIDLFGDLRIVLQEVPGDRGSLLLRQELQPRDQTLRLPGRLSLRTERYSFSTSCGFMPKSTTFITTWTCPLWLHEAAHHAEGPDGPPLPHQKGRNDGVVGPLAPGDDVGVIRVQGEAVSAVVEPQ